MAWTVLVKRILRNFVISVPVTVTFLDHVGYIAKVEGVSMQPSLNPTETDTCDFVFLNKWAIRNYDIKHGDVVSLICPKNPDQKLIKRIIAVEGDIIQSSNRFRYVKVPTGHCWVEGDHRGQSMDSNFFGPVSVGLITAKASHIVWPPSRWQRLQCSVPDGREPLKGNDPMQWPWSVDMDSEDYDIHFPHE